MQKKGIPADDPRMRELQMEQFKMMKTRCSDWRLSADAFAIPFADCALYGGYDFDCFSSGNIFSGCLIFRRATRVIFSNSLLRFR